MIHSAVNSDTLYKELVALIESQKVLNRAILPESKFCEVTGLYGDDVEDFFEIYINRFNVDFARDGFFWHDYFEPEGGWVWPFDIVFYWTLKISNWLLRFIYKTCGVSYEENWWNQYCTFMIKVMDIRERKEVTIAEIFLWAKAGYWYPVSGDELHETIESLNKLTCAS
jgi:hypothetical protein